MATPPSDSGRGAAPAKKRRWKRFAFRTTVRLIGVAILGLGLVAVPLWFVPLSFSWSDEWLKDRTFEATGLRLDFSEAEWTIGRGHVRIDSPVLIDPENEERKLLDLPSVEVKIAMGSVVRSLFTSEKRVDIPLITAYGRFVLEFEERDGRIGPSENLQRVIDIALPHLRNETDPEVDVQFGKVSLGPVDVRLTSITEEGPHPLVYIKDSDLMAEFNGEKMPVNVVLNGETRGKNEGTRFTLRLRPRPDLEEMAIDLRVQPFDSRRHLMADLPRDFSTERLHVSGNLVRESDARWVFHSEARTVRVALIEAGPRGSDHEFIGAGVNASIVWDREAKALELKSFVFKSNDGQCDLTANGRLELFEPYQHTLHVDELELRGQGLALVERIIFGEGHITTPDEGKFRLEDGNFAGRLGELRPRHVGGKVQLSGVTLSLPGLPDPIYEARLKAELTDSLLTLSEGHGVIQGVPVQVEGFIRGDLIDLKVDQAELNWETVGEVTGLNELVAQAPQASGWEILGGQVTGSGSLKLEGAELDNWDEMVEKATWEATIRFNGAEVSHPSLKQPITDLNGRLVVLNRSKAELVNLEGKIEDVSFSVSGTVQGTDNFWNEASIVAVLEARLNLENIPKYFSWVDAKAPDLPDLGGRVLAQTNLDGDLDDWATMKFAGRVTIQELSLPLEIDRIKAQLEMPSVELEIDPGEIRVVEARGTLGEIDIRIDEAVIKPGGGVVVVSAEGPLTGYQRILPGLLDQFEVMIGRATATNRLVLTPAENRGDAVETFIELISLYAEDSDREGWSLEDVFVAENSGTARLEGGELLLHAMPESARVTGANARLEYNDVRMWTVEPASAQFGLNSVNTQAEMDIHFGAPGEPNELRFTVTGGRANLDDWIKKWRPMKPRSGQRSISGSPFDPRAVPKTRITVIVATNEVEYRGLRGRNLTGEVVFESYGPARIKLSWRNVRAESGPEGEIHAEGYWIREEDRHAQRWRFDVVKPMDAEDLFRAFYEGGDTVGFEEGKLAEGFVDLRRDGAKGIPFNGEGRIYLTDSKFISNAVFGSLGGALGLDAVFSDITFTRIRGDFDVVDDAIVFDDSNPMIFENPSSIHPLNLRAEGRIGPESKLDMVFAVQLLPIVGRIPLLGSLLDSVKNFLTGDIIRTRVRGTLDDPQTSLMMPLIP